MPTRPNEGVRGTGELITLLVTNMVRTRSVRDRRSYAQVVRDQRAQLDALRRRLQAWADDRELTGIDFLSPGHRLAVRLRCSEDIEAELRDIRDLVVVRERTSNGVA